MTLTERLEEANAALQEAQTELETIEVLCQSTIPGDEMLTRRGLLRAKVEGLPELIARIEAQMRAQQIAEASAARRREIGNAEAWALDLVQHAEAELSLALRHILVDIAVHQSEAQTLGLALPARIHEALGAMLGLHGHRGIDAMRQEIADAAARQR